MSGALVPDYVAERGVGASASSDGSVVWVACLPGGPIHVLDGVAATIWLEATTGPLDGLVERVARAWDQDADAVRADVLAFVDDLVGRGLLARAMV